MKLPGTAAELRELVALLPRPLFDELGRALWGLWDREEPTGPRVVTREELMEAYLNVARFCDDPAACDGALEIVETIAAAPGKIPHVISTDTTGTTTALYTRELLIVVGAEPARASARPSC